MMVNKYEGRCVVCGGRVPANGGILKRSRRTGRYYVKHLACNESGSSAVDAFVIGGKEYTRNKRGRCEDAPCCGCCTI